MQILSGLIRLDLGRAVELLARKMNSRIIWVTAIMFATVHVAISICFVLLAAATSDMPEWGIPMGAYLTTFPLADFYDDITTGQSTAVAVAVPMLVGTLLYAAIGAGVGMAIDRLRNRG
jgi:hypothetical protein